MLIHRTLGLVVFFVCSFGLINSQQRFIPQQQPQQFAPIQQQPPQNVFPQPIPSQIQSRVAGNNNATVIPPPTTFQPQTKTDPPFFLPKPALFQLSSSILNTNTFTFHPSHLAKFSRFQIWYLTSQILTTIEEHLKPADYITMLQPQLIKGIPSVNLTQALSTKRPDIIKTLVEQSSDMLISQQAVIVQKIVKRISEPLVIRMIMNTESPGELFSFINPTALMKNMGIIIKTIGETPGALQVKLLPRNILAMWLQFIKENGKVQRWAAEDLLGKSFFGSANKLDLALLGIGCSDLEIVAPQEVLIVIMKYRQDLFEIRKHEKDISFPLNLRNCALAKVMDYLKLRNASDNENIIGRLSMAEINMIGGEILTAIPTQALENIPSEIRQAILEEIGQLSTADLYSLLPTYQIKSYADKLYNDVSSLPSNQIPAKMGNLIFYSEQFTSGNWSKEIISDVLQKPLKAVCLTKQLRSKWSELLKSAFGQDISLWTPADLAIVGDLLITLPDLDKISTEALSRAATPILKQTVFHVDVKGKTFAKSCMESLEDTGYYESYLGFMRKLLQAIQVMVSSIRTVDQVMGEMGKNRLRRAIQTVGSDKQVTMQTPLSPTKSNTPNTLSMMSAANASATTSTATKANAPQMSASDPRNQQMTTNPIMQPQGASQVVQKSADMNPQLMARMVTSSQPTASAPDAASTVTTPQMSAASVSPQSAVSAPTVPNSRNQPITSVMINPNGVQRVPQQGFQNVAPNLPPTKPLRMVTSSPMNFVAVPVPKAQQNKQNFQQFDQQINLIGQSQQFQQMNAIPQGQPQGFGQVQSPQPQGASQVQSSQPQGASQVQSSQPQGASQVQSSQSQGASQVQSSQPQGVSQVQTPQPQQSSQSPPGSLNAFMQQNPASRVQQVQPFHPNQPNFSGRSQPGMGNFNDNTTTTSNTTEPTDPTSTDGTSNSTDPITGRSAGDNPLEENNSTKAESARSLESSSVAPLEISCHALKSAGPALIGMTLQDFNQLSAEDLFDCVEPIGLIDWSIETKQAILRLLADKLHLTPEKINTLTLIELGGLINGFSVESNDDGWENSTEIFDLSEIDLTLPDSLDSLAILGTQIEEAETLRVLATKFATQNNLGKSRGAIARPDNLRSVIWALGNIVCGMDEQLIGHIFETDRTLFIDTSPMLGRLVGCSFEMLQILAEFAVQPSNYGESGSWNEFDVDVIGVVIAGLKPSVLSQIPASSMAGLHPSAIKEMPTASFQTLTPDQISKIPYESAVAIPSHHIEVLSESQMEALNGVISVLSDGFQLPDVDISEDEEVRSVDVNATNTNETITGRSAETTNVTDNTTSTTTDKEKVEVIDAHHNTTKNATHPQPDQDVVLPPSSASVSRSNKFSSVFMLVIFFLLNYNLLMNPTYN